MRYHLLTPTVHITPDHFDSVHFLIDDCLSIQFNLVVVALYLLHHDIVSILVLKFIDDRDSPVSLFFRADFGMVHNDFSMEYFLVYLSPKLSETAPTNVPWDRLAILEAGMSESSCVLMEVDTSWRLMETDCRC